MSSAPPLLDLRIGHARQAAAPGQGHKIELDAAASEIVQIDAETWRVDLPFSGFSGMCQVPWPSLGVCFT
jgi:hypothetical protein